MKNWSTYLHDQSNILLLSLKDKLLWLSGYVFQLHWLLMEIRSKEFLSFVLIFPQSDKQGDGISMTVIHYSTRSGQGEERTVVSKMSNVVRELGQYIHKLTYLLRWIYQFAFFSQLHLTFCFQGSPPRWLIYLLMTHLIWKKKHP